MDRRKYIACLDILFEITREEAVKDNEALLACVVGCYDEVSNFLQLKLRERNEKCN